jgi:zinc transporter ZupT
MTTLLIGLLIPLLGTMLGASFVFFMKRDMPERLQKALLGFASGVMGFRTGFRADDGIGRGDGIATKSDNEL